MRPARRAEGDTSLVVHDQILARIAASDLWCAPMGEVFKFISERAALH